MKWNFREGNPNNLMGFRYSTAQDMTEMMFRDEYKKLHGLWFHSNLEL